jgi:TonB-dependent SusC/RagA subfamily outer membrane receptor
MMLMVLCTLAYGQARTVTGTVKDESGNPVPFATVTEAGTKNATTADANGNFSINIQPSGRITLSAAGYQAQTVTYDAQNPNITLRRGEGQLAEVVVTALGQTRSKDRIGYSASTFKSEDVVRSAPVSPLDALQGRVPGADISTVGGQPGGSSKIILRGYSSLSTSANGGNQALIVVDGVPFNNSRLGSFNDFLNSGGVDFGNGLNDLNPNDIESINILKGAAATSLYGSRATSGVVLITTKKGKAGKLAIDFSSSAVFSSVGRLPSFQNTWGQGWNFEHWKEENGSWGPKLDGQNRLWGSLVDNSRLLKPYSAVEDNVRDFYDLGSEYNNNISLRGGGEAANFYFSYGNVSSNGILPGNSDVYKRNTLSVRGQLKQGKFIASASLNYINKHGRTANTTDDAAGSSTFENIIQIARDIPIVDF